MRRTFRMAALGLALGLAGLLPGAAGALDAHTQLGWLALAAPALGTWLAGQRPPAALLVAVPLGWLVVGVLATGAPAPWAACAVLGLYGCGVALGRRHGAHASGMVLATTLVLAGASLGFGWLAGGAELARAGAPGLAARLLDLSPLVLVFDCAGFDWAHAQPDVYARSGVEWFPRRPWSGSLAGPTVLVVGCLLALLVPAPRGRTEGVP